VLNKIDKIEDQSILHVLQARHPNSVSISAATHQGIDQLRDSVISALSSEFVMLKIETNSGNGKLFAYLASNAEIIRQEFVDDKALFVCSVPKHLLHKLEGPDVTITKMTEAVA
jgi:GTP-binding protein HflX